MGTKGNWRRGPAPPPADCGDCHSVSGFSPARFELEQHAKTPFPLTGAHRATACRNCHLVDAQLAKRVDPAVRAKLARQRRPERVALVVMRPKRAPGDCSDCHRDPHQGQFAAQTMAADDCAACHTTESFAKVRFDHNRDSRFPLTRRAQQGALRGLPQAGDHPPPAARRRSATSRSRRPVRAATSMNTGDSSRRARTDEANRREARADGKDCSFCHATDSFKKTSFTHQDRRFTTFALAGKHSSLPCGSCHRPVQIAGPSKREPRRVPDLPRWAPTGEARLRPTRSRPCVTDPCPATAKAATLISITAPSGGSSLEGCRGRVAVSLAIALGAGRALAAPPVVPRPAKQPASAAAAPAAKCASCHVESGWSPARFDHERTGFLLREAHARLSCISCHPQDFKTRIADTCSGCHRDRHRGELGLHCEGCHDEKTWKTSLFGPDTHRRTSFPLSGKHAVIPCRECHGDLRDMTFSRAPVACIGCHRGDFDAAALRRSITSRPAST